MIFTESYGEHLSRSVLTDLLEAGVASWLVFFTSPLLGFHLFWSKPCPFPPLPFALSLFPCIHLAWGLQRPRRVGFSVPGELKGEPEGARV